MTADTPNDDEAEPLYLESSYEGERYRWSCVHCGEVNDDEFDPRDRVVTCEACSNQSKVTWAP